jgi:hypothetical protein
VRVAADDAKGGGTAAEHTPSGGEAASRQEPAQPASTSTGTRTSTSTSTAAAAAVAQGRGLEAVYGEAA